MKCLTLKAALPLCMLLLAFAGCNKATVESPAAHATAAVPAAVESEAAASTDPADFILASKSLDNGHMQATFSVAGMTCGGCEGMVEKTLSGVAGVDACEASSKDSTAVITYDPAQTSTDVLLASLQSTGYKPQPIQVAGANGCCGGCKDKAAIKAANGEACCGGCAKGEACATDCGDKGVSTTNASAGGCNCQNGGECTCGDNCKCAEGKEVKTTNASVNGGCNCQNGGECSCGDNCKCAEKAATTASACNCQNGGVCTCGDNCKCAETKEVKKTAGIFDRLFAAIFPPAHAAEEKPKAKEQKLPKLPAVTKGCERATFSVEYCCAGGCPPKTETAISKLKGVAYVKADYATLTCTVDYRIKDISKDKIKHAILDLGYVVDGEQPAEPHHD